MKRIEFDYPNKSYENAMFGIFRLPDLRCEELRATIDIPVFFSKFFEKSIDALLTGMQPLVFETYVRFSGKIRQLSHFDSIGP